MAENNEKKLSYEELEKAANGLLEQRNQLMARVQQLSEVAAFKRIDYLFKVVENADKFPSNFVITCTEELVQTMSIPEKEEKETVEE